MNTSSCFLRGSLRKVGGIPDSLGTAGQRRIAASCVWSPPSPRTPRSVESKPFLSIQTGRESTEVEGEEEAESRPLLLPKGRGACYLTLAAWWVKSSTQ